ncbi:bifunctional serine/threonine-protein kinase/formylglycine-generating enzyme family protein [Dokdonella sp.]|uniref:bifunctional serine/threonine-protein kinase/formylglycine-generating enzyme family protein n=1 Tax=Dokdonella sp. TaxID=2291710 RepID=UPI001B285AC4|nr:bifunctional serine/threonine-protein kinase/formylglycine-generating enzyme family protein [Dokdonella sp.]MBO9663625.1 SUMF1/EgtB/PvdO family nonheme iron enzyme [Dokdonella sp.]
MTRLNLPFEIPGYRIVRRLGLGGMATVYLAVQESLGRQVAVKVLASERAPDDEIARRFQHEARTIARLDHPHIVSIYEVGRTSDGSIYYTMPYLANGDLLSRNLREDPQRVLEVVRAVAEALGFAHDQGIVHRDVKPENVLFDKLDRPMLADFGIALSSTRAPRVTREGATIGSSGYMSPEQARGQSLDGRSDLYSLGVVCYELLTGELPYQGADSLSVALAHIEKPVPRLPLTRRLWQPLIDKALAKTPDARFQSAEEMLAALALIEKRLAAPPQFALSRWSMALIERLVAIPRQRRAIALGIGMLVALAGLLALLPHRPDRAVPPTAAPAPPAASHAAANDAAPPSTDAPAAGSEQAPEEAASPPVDDAQAKDDARAQRLKDAAALIARGQLVAPAGDNAAERYLDILAEEPRQRDALKGIAHVLNLLATRAAKAIEGRDVQAAIEPIGAGISLAERAQLGDGPAFVAFAAPIRRAVEQRRARSGGDPFDTAQARALQPLQGVLSKLDPPLARVLQDDLDRPQRLLAEGGAFRDVDGPPLVIVPGLLAAAGHVENAFAVSTGDITRGAYERFVESTGRATAPCRESQRLFARDGLSWRAPGFTQADDHPVVCVSWEDASAYASWLSRKTGARYRLPTQREWLLLAQPAEAGTACGAANLAKRSNCDDGYAQTAPVGRFATTPPGVYDIAGNVSQWIDGCAKPGAGECGERSFRGLSWRDDGDESNLARVGLSAGDVGYASVGFRLVRELPQPDAERREQR